MWNPKSKCSIDTSEDAHFVKYGVEDQSDISEEHPSNAELNDVPKCLTTINIGSIHGGTLYINCCPEVRSKHRYNSKLVKSVEQKSNIVKCCSNKKYMGKLLNKVKRFKQKLKALVGMCCCASASDLLPVVNCDSESANLHVDSTPDDCSIYAEPDLYDLQGFREKADGGFRASERQQCKQITSNGASSTSHYLISVENMLSNTGKLVTQESYISIQEQEKEHTYIKTENVGSTLNSDESPIAVNDTISSMQHKNGHFQYKNGPLPRRREEITPAYLRSFPTNTCKKEKIAVGKHYCVSNNSEVECDGQTYRKRNSEYGFHLRTNNEDSKQYSKLCENTSVFSENSDEHTEIKTVLPQVDLKLSALKVPDPYYTETEAKHSRQENNYSHLECISQKDAFRTGYPWDTCSSERSLVCADDLISLDLTESTEEVASRFQNSHVLDSHRNDIEMKLFSPDREDIEASTALYLERSKHDINGHTTIYVKERNSEIDELVSIPTQQLILDMSTTTEAVENGEESNVVTTSPCPTSENIDCGVSALHSKVGETMVQCRENGVVPKNLHNSCDSKFTENRSLLWLFQGSGCIQTCFHILAILQSVENALLLIKVSDEGIMQEVDISSEAQNDSELITVEAEMKESRLKIIEDTSERSSVICGEAITQPQSRTFPLPDHAVDNADTGDDQSMNFSKAVLPGVEINEDAVDFSNKDEKELTTKRRKKCRKKLVSKKKRTGKTRVSTFEKKLSFQCSSDFYSGLHENKCNISSNKTGQKHHLKPSDSYHQYGSNKSIKHFGELSCDIRDSGTGTMTDSRSISCIVKKKSVIKQHQKYLNRYFRANQIQLKSVVRQLHVEHTGSCIVLGIESYFDRLNNGPLPTIRERMQYEWNRLGTFHNYTGSGNGLALARNGFYHDHTEGSSSTRCFLCDARHSTWEMFDDISAEHRRQSPNCPIHENREDESVNVPIRHDGSSASSATSRNVPSTQSSSSSSAVPKLGSAGSSLSSSSSTVSAGPARSTSAGAVREVSRSLQGGESVPQQPTDDPENSDRTLLATSQPHMHQALGRTGNSYSNNIAPQRINIPPQRNNIAAGATSNVGIDPSGSETLDITSQLPDTRPSSILGGPVGSGAFAGNFNTNGLNSTAQTTTSSKPTAPRQSNAASATATLSSNARRANPAPGTGGRTDPTSTVLIDNPKHPDYIQLGVRESSFQGWPDYLDQTPRQMAEAGFYFVGVADFSRCFCCGGGLRNWEPGDDPMLEHTRWFPRCEYVNKLKGERYVAAVQRRHREHMAEQQREQIELAQRRDDNRNPPDPMSTDVAAVLREIGYSGERTREAILAVRQLTGSTQITTQQVLTWLLDDEDRRTSPTTGLGVRYPANNVSSTQTVITSTSSAPAATSVVGAGTTSSTVSSTSTNNRTEVQQSGTPNSSSSSESGSQPTGTENVSSSSSGSYSTMLEMQSPSSMRDSNEDKSTVPENTTGREATSKNKKKKAKKKTKSKTGTKSGGATGGGSVDAKSLMMENEKLREMQTCKICMERAVNTTLLPCGHLVCCDACASRLQHCPICRKKIKGTVKTFMS